MPALARFTTLLSLPLASGTAAASDYSGAATILIGMPAFIIFNVTLGVFLALPANRVRKAVATAALIPLLILGLILSQDALSLFSRASGDWILSCLYFALVALSLFLHYKLISRQPHADGR